MKGYLGIVAARACAAGPAARLAVRPAVPTLSPLIAFDQRLQLASPHTEIDAALGNPDLAAADPLADTGLDGGAEAVVAHPRAAPPAIAPTSVVVAAEQWAPLSSGSSAPVAAPRPSAPPAPVVQLEDPFGALASPAARAVAPRTVDPLHPAAPQQERWPAEASPRLARPAPASLATEPPTAAGPVAPTRQPVAPLAEQPAPLPNSSSTRLTPSRAPSHANTSSEAPERTQQTPQLDYARALGQAFSTVNRWLTTPPKDQQAAAPTAAPAPRVPAAISGPAERAETEDPAFRAQQASPQLVIGRVTVNVLPPPKPVRVPERTERRRPLRPEAPPSGSAPTSTLGFGARQR